MHKIITKKYVRGYVEENIGDISEETLRGILEKKNIPCKKGLNKETLVNIIKYHKIDLCFVYKSGKREAFGIDKEKLLELLDCKEEFLKKLISENIIGKTYVKDGIQYYSLSDVYELSKEKLSKFKSKRTRVKKSYKEEQKGKLKVIRSIEGRLRDVEENKTRWKRLLKKDRYIILCLGATGNNPKSDEIVSLSIIDMKGHVLFDKTFKTVKKIGADGYHLNGREESEKTFLEWQDEIRKILSDKIVISYEIEGAMDLLKGNGFDEEITPHNLMKMYMEYVHSKYIIRFKRALNMQKLNSNERCSTLEDCENTLRLVKSVIKECEENIDLLETNIKKLSK